MTSYPVRANTGFNLHRPTTRPMHSRPMDLGIVEGDSIANLTAEPMTPKSRGWNSIFHATSLGWTELDK